MKKYTKNRLISCFKSLKYFIYIVWGHDKVFISKHFYINSKTLSYQRIIIVLLHKGRHSYLRGPYYRRRYLIKTPFSFQYIQFLKTKNMFSFIISLFLHFHFFFIKSIIKILMFFHVFVCFLFCLLIKHFKVFQLICWICNYNIIYVVYLFMLAHVLISFSLG